MQNSALIKTQDLVKIYPVGWKKLVALDHVNLEFKTGEFAGLVGPSGSGKTTMLNIVGSLDSPTEGDAVVMGKKISTLSHKQAPALRKKHIGFIFQTFNLLPVYNVYENVEISYLGTNRKNSSLCNFRDTASRISGIHPMANNPLSGKKQFCLYSWPLLPVH